MSDNSEGNINVAAMLTTVVGIGDTPVCSELSNKLCIAHKIKLISCILSAILFLVSIIEITNYDYF